jgi:hypothetical protein
LEIQVWVSAVWMMLNSSTQDLIFATPEPLFL